MVRKYSVEEEERRRSRLRHSPVNILGTLDGQPVQILDLSLTGLGFETSLPLEPEKSYRIDLYTEVGELTVAGKLAWIREVDRVETKEGLSVDVRRAGIRFGPLPHEDAKTLQRLVEHTERQGTGSRQEREEFTTEFSQDEVTALVREKLQKRKPE